MDRRAFLGTVGLLAAPLAAQAQQAGRVPRIGWLTSSAVHAKMQRVLAVWNPRNDTALRALPTLEQAGRALRVQIELIEARDAKSLARTLSSRARGRAEALLLITDAFFWSQREQMAALALKHRLPAIFPETEFAVSGGLMGYGPNIANNFRRAADYVDKILKGAKPAELPIEQPTKFELVINLKTAKALRLTIPPSLLQRADQVIE